MIYGGEGGSRTLERLITSARFPSECIQPLCHLSRLTSVDWGAEQRTPRTRMKLTLIRHGPTEWNATRRFQGRTDVPLSAPGRAAARTIAQRLQDEPISRIYSSDLSRALSTARIVGAARAAEVVTDERLREFDFGRWEGLTWDEIVTRYPHLANLGFRAAKQYAPEGGESFAQVRERLASFLGDLAKEPFDAVAVVTHAGPLHAILSVLDLEQPGLRFTPGGITRIEMERGKAVLVSLDERGHLEGEK